MNDFNVTQFIKDIIKFSPRQGENEKKVAKFIVFLLKIHKIKYKLQEFSTKIPIIKKETLVADGKTIKCKGCSFIGGKIENKDNIVSSLISSQPLIDHTNINFNPSCKGISLSNFYFAPSLAVKASDLTKIIKAKNIFGMVKVLPYKYRSSNILVGNLESPKNILFAHYDSIEVGAIDNASGVGALMYLILKYPYVINDSLIVFSGNEELSYDYPVYWGHGFREFEIKNNNLLKKAKKIFIVDCVGNGKTLISQDKELTTKGFPLMSLKKLENKIFFAHGDIDDLMRVYHSSLDEISGIKEKNIIEAVKIILNKLES